MALGKYLAQMAAKGGKAAKDIAKTGGYGMAQGTLKGTDMLAQLAQKHAKTNPRLAKILLSGAESGLDLAGVIKRNPEIAGMIGGGVGAAGLGAGAYGLSELLGDEE